MSIPLLRLSFAAALCLLPALRPLHADDRPKRVPMARVFSPQQFQREQEAFIIKEAGITPLEAARFFPLFQKSQARQREINWEIRKCMRAMRKAELTDKEAGKLLNTLKDLNEQRTEEENKSYDDAERCLGAYKALKVVSAKQKFDRRIFHKMVDRKK